MARRRAERGLRASGIIIIALGESIVAIGVGALGLARDSYYLLHLPMVVEDNLRRVGIKQTLAHVGKGAFSEGRSKITPILGHMPHVPSTRS